MIFKKVTVKISPNQIFTIFVLETGARGTHYTFPAGSDNVCLAPSPGATGPRVPAASSVNAHHLPHATHVATHDPP